MSACPCWFEWRIYRQKWAELVQGDFLGRFCPKHTGQGQQLFVLKSTTSGFSMFFSDTWRALYCFVEIVRTA